VGVWVKGAPIFTAGVVEFGMVVDRGRVLRAGVKECGEVRHRAQDNLDGEERKEAGVCRTRGAVGF